MNLASWSPDGGQILGTFIMGIPGQPVTSSIGVVPASGGDFVPLKSIPGKGVWAVGFSPDGKYILYTRSMPEGPRAYLMPADVKPEVLPRVGDAEAAALLARMAADGKSEVPLAWGAGSVESPVWTPDGSRVVFVSNRSGSPALWSGRVVDGKPVGEPELLKADFRNHLIGFASDGSLFYRMSSPQNDVYLANLDPATGRVTSEPRRINRQGIGNAWGRIAWLPDGKSLSFWEKRNERDVLVVHTLATGEERELWDRAPGGGRDYTGWFPDGRSLMSVEGKGENRTWCRVDSLSRKTLATWTVPAIPLLWLRTPAIFTPSADRMTLFFAQLDQTTGPCPEGICTYIISARSIETGKDREIFRTHDIPSNLAASPDGRQLAVLAADKDYALMIAPAAGGPPRDLYRGKDRLEGGLAWTADGKQVLAFRHEQRQAAIWSFPASGGPPEKSTPYVGIKGDCAASPDGTQIAFVGGGVKREIWIASDIFGRKR